MTTTARRSHGSKRRDGRTRIMVAVGLAGAATLSGIMALRTSARTRTSTEPFRSEDEALVLDQGAEWSGMMPVPSHHDIPSHIRDDRRSGMQTADQVRRLLDLRSRIDRLAWNTLSGRRIGGTRSMSTQDWSERCMFLVSIGSAFEDMAGVLAQALADRDGTGAHGAFVSRTFEAYLHLARARVPAAWRTERGTPGATMSDIVMWAAWRELCEAVANVIGLEPRYGTQ